MRLVISGATSAPGERVVERLAREFGASALACLVRPTSDARRVQALGVRCTTGDITEPSTYRHLLTPTTTFVDMSRIRNSHIVVEALQHAGVTRAYFVSTTAVHSALQTETELYRANERAIRESGVAYTILRPSMIYGSERDKNMHKLIAMANRFRVAPMVAGGDYMLQPVHMDDLAAAVTAAVLTDASTNKTYDLAGPAALSFREVVDEIASALGKRIFRVPIPRPLALAAARVADLRPVGPVTGERVRRSMEDKVTDTRAASLELGFGPRPFRTGIRQEVERLRAIGSI